jgi:nucleoid DNA-binding protein
MRRTTWGLLGLGGLLALGMALAADAQVVEQPKKAPTLKEGIAKESKEKAATVEKILKALGPAGREQLAAGREIELPGLGVLRVVRIAEHKDLVKGIPAVIPATNYVEFVPAADLVAAANAKGAVPAKTVEAYEFRVFPTRDEGLKAEPRKVPRSRAGR